MSRIHSVLARLAFVVVAPGLLALQAPAQREVGAAASEAAATVFVGHVLGPDGAPAAGAVVVTSAGGQAVTDAEGAFSLEVGVPVDADSVRVSAVLGSGTGSLVGGAQVGALALWGTTSAGTLVLEQAATCQPSWLPTFGAEQHVQKPGVNGPVLAFAAFDDGSGPALYAGGGFTAAGGEPANFIAKWNGASWSALGSGMNNQVNALTVFDDGSGAALYAGGAFTTAGGVPANFIAKWDGTSWSALGSGMSDYVTTLAVFDDGSGPALYVGGYFYTAGGVTAHFIARWNGGSWSALGSGMSGGGIYGTRVFALTVFDDGSGPALYAGGDFTTAGGVTANSIAKWDGTTWSALGSGADSYVNALTVFDDGSGPALYAGGNFLVAGGVTALSIARWDGSAWSAVGFLGLNGTVESLTVFDDGSGPALYAGGVFVGAAFGIPASNIVKWNGTSWSALGSGTDSYVNALTVFDDGSGPALYAGGDFTTAGGVVANRIAQWNRASWSALGGTVSSGMNGGVLALTVFDDGSGPALYAGGDFTSAALGVVTNRIAKWDGTTWSALGSGTDNVVRALTVFDDGSGPALYAGGDFTTAGGVAANRIAKWDGTTWSALGSGMAGVVIDFPTVYALTAFDDGSGPALYAGGSFTTAGGVAANHIAKWNGSSWSALGSGMAVGMFGSLPPAVYALTVFDDGGGPALYAGGQFNKAGGVAAKRIAKWDGTSWSALGSGIDGPAPVFALTVFDDGSGPALYAGGDFTTAGGMVANRIAQWNGTSWSALGSGTDNVVRALTVFDDGSGPALYACGEFTTADGVVANFIAKWDGTTWSALGSGMDGNVLALAVFDDGSGPALYAGGPFTSAIDSGDSFLAKWGGCSATASPWTNLASGLAGVSGIPELTGFGDLVAGTSGNLGLGDAAPSALALLFLSTANTPTPFKGGTLLTVPVLQTLPLATDSQGDTLLPWTAWPSELSGVSLYFQYAIQDSAAVKGVALSNALGADVP